MNERRRLFAIAAGAAVAASLGLSRGAAMAQTAGKKRSRLVRIGRISEGGSERGAAGTAALRQALRQHGYANVEVEARFAEGDADRLPALAKELARMNIDVIWTNGSAASQAAKDATRRIPIVMVSADAVRGRLVTNLARPEANVTGLTLVGTEIVAKRIEMLKETAPKTVLVTGVVPGPDAMRAPIVVDWVRQSEAAARALGLEFRYAELAPEADQWNDAFVRFAATPGNALSVVESPHFLAQSVRLGQLALRHRLPAVYSFSRHVEDGGLMSYGVDLQHIFERSAHYVARILDGARPRDLPVEQPTKYEIALNAATAKALGLTFPRSALLLADKVIE